MEQGSSAVNKEKGEEDGGQRDKESKEAMKHACLWRKWWQEAKNNKRSTTRLSTLVGGQRGQKNAVHQHEGGPERCEVKGVWGLKKKKKIRTDEMGHGIVGKQMTEAERSHEGTTASLFNCGCKLNSFFVLSRRDVEVVFARGV